MPKFKYSYQKGNMSVEYDRTVDLWEIISLSEEDVVGAIMDTVRTVNVHSYLALQELIAEAIDSHQDSPKVWKVSWTFVDFTDTFGAKLDVLGRYIVEFPNHGDGLKFKYHLEQLAILLDKELDVNIQLLS